MSLVFSLPTILRAIPETMHLLRGDIYRLPKVGGDNNPESRKTDKPSSRAPMNLGAVDAADLQLESLAYWAEVAGVDMTNLGKVWRRPDGSIRGVLYDDCRPADRLAERLLAAIQHPRWVEPDGMHAHLHGLLAEHAKTWPSITDILHESSLPDETPANDQPGLFDSNGVPETMAG